MRRGQSDEPTATTNPIFRFRKYAKSIIQFSLSPFYNIRKARTYFH